MATGLSRIAAVLACVTLGGLVTVPVHADEVCPNPITVAGFKTCADVAKAEQEGAIVVYSPDPEEGTAKLMAAFHEAFPKISTNFIRLQTGALYQKLQTERRARSYLVDVLQLTDVSYVLDFQKRNSYIQYVSPEMSAYKSDHKSSPEGYWTWGAFIISGIAYNPKLVKAEEAPKTWKDMLNPRWTGVISAKIAASGLQHVSWYELRELYGEDYWKQFAELKPRGFDSYVQQFDRLVSGQDAVAHTAQYSAYLLAKAKGAPIEFVFPEEGLPTTPGVWGIVADTPHPNAARLFMDWFLGIPGQKVYDTILASSSPRPDAPPPPGGLPSDKFKVLYPKDWQKFLATQTQYVRDWNQITGVR